MTRRHLAALSTAALILSTVAVSASAQGIEDPIREPIRKSDIHVKLVRVATGMTAPNWGTTDGVHGNRLYVVDQPGILWAINLRTNRKLIFADLRELVVPLGAFGPGTFDERGFLGVAFHPRYGANGLLYTYTSERPTRPADFSTMPPGEEANHQSVVREWRVPNPRSPASVVDTSSSRVLLRIDEPQFNHNGGAVNFGPDDRLYIALGDGGQADDQGVGHSPQGNGQDPGNVLGTILRIAPRGSNSANGRYGIPRDNPFVGQSGALPEIFAFGFRNPFRFSFDSATGDMFVGDVGQNDIEEVDVVTAGGNFGWRVKEGTFLFDPNGDEDGFVTDNIPGRPSNMVDPIAQYDHDEGIAVIGGFVYRGSDVPPLRGRYVFGDLARTFQSDGRLFHLTRSNEIRELQFIGRREFGLFLLGFGQDAHGELYVLANRTGVPFERTGVVFRIDHELDARLTGENEIDPETGERGAGDLDGLGSGHVRLIGGQNQVCFSLRWRRIGRPLAAHIHAGRASINGPVVVDLLPNADAFQHSAGRGSASGCTEGVSDELINAIRKTPRAYYVNIHNSTFPNGALRGQLH